MTTTTLRLGGLSTRTLAELLLAPYGAFEPVVLRGALERPEEFFGEEVERQVAASDGMRAMVALFREQALVRREDEPASYKPQGIFASLDAGAAAQFRGLQRTPGPLREFCLELHELGNGAWETVQAIGLDTQPGEPALGLHNDPYGVIGAQTRRNATGEGAAKQWTLYRPPWATEEEARAAYLARSKKSRESGRPTYFNPADLEPWGEVVLSSTDAMVVPPYYPHFVKGVGQKGSGPRSYSISVSGVNADLFERYGEEPSLSLALIDS